MQKITKFKLIQIIAITLISFPIGIYLHNKLAEKINLIVYIEPGKIILKNICESFVRVEPPEIISRGDLLLLEKQASSQFSKKSPELNKMRLEIGFLKKEGVYKISIGGFASELVFMRNEASSLVDEIGKLEKQSFLVKYAGAQLHCGSAIYPAYHYTPAVSGSSIYEINRVFSKLHINIISISPFIILLILLGFYHYVKSNMRIIFSKK